MSRDSPVFKVIVYALDDRDSISSRDRRLISWPPRPDPTDLFFKEWEPEVRLSSLKRPNNPLLSDVGPRCLVCV